MLFQDASNIDPLAAVAFVAVGIVFIIFVYTAWYTIELRRRRLKQPSLILFDPIMEKLNYVGRFSTIEKHMPLRFIKPKEGKEDGFEGFSHWAVCTNTVSMNFLGFISRKREKRYSLVILPAYGKYEDMVIESETLSTIKMLKVKIIGTGRGGGRYDPIEGKYEKPVLDGVKEWLKLVLEYRGEETIPDTEIDVAAIPENFVFVRPIYKDEMADEIYKECFNVIQSASNKLSQFKGLSKVVEPLKTN